MTRSSAGSGRAEQSRSPLTRPLRPTSRIPEGRVSSGPTTPVKEAASILAGRRICSLLVLDPDGDVVGVVSESDILRHAGRAASREPARPESMSSIEVLTVRAELECRAQALDETLALPP